MVGEIDLSVIQWKSIENVVDLSLILFGEKMFLQLDTGWETSLRLASRRGACEIFHNQYTTFFSFCQHFFSTFFH